MQQMIFICMYIFTCCSHIPFSVFLAQSYNTWYTSLQFNVLSINTCYKNEKPKVQFSIYFNRTAVNLRISAQSVSESTIRTTQRYCPSKVIYPSSKLLATALPNQKLYSSQMPSFFPWFL